MAAQSPSLVYSSSKTSTDEKAELSNMKIGADMETMMVSYNMVVGEVRRDNLSLYEAALTQSRQPEFYADMDVPDSVDGRFEMLALHCGLLVFRLRKHEETKQSQALFDKMFKVMDPMLREMGVGDLSVPKHMKRMMQGFNGRIINYTQAIEKNDKEALKGALVRNVYGTLEEKDIPADRLEALADYLMISAQMETKEPEFAPLNNNNKGVNHVAA